ncbi:molybdenum cofactor biosynthesis protein (plasmid) [Halostagnicola larsenii XH-48]|uniref:Molybdenum cofactor biosynthesis protein n=1 Tax=Halostagnicola larsenii XH-48 TaxID=797299 RepID=W0JVY0_9EURY|nr:molybdopterin molybdotransferase MoeA [Halostagnicola larsenii]AHG01223.1 molybdenum cofactor biosynthesis protein [Halostagnicola larsenii XH-48]
MDDHDDLLWRREAVDRTLAVREAFLEERATRSRSVDDLAGCHLAEPISAPADRPADDRATMDGYAYASDDEGPLEVVSKSSFPESDRPSIERGKAIEIATGAPLPERADTVVKQEDVVVENGTFDAPSLPAGTYVYERGSNLVAGDRLYERGDRLSALDAVLLRDIGYETLEGFEPFSVGVLATGTEIHEGKHTDLDSPMLCNLLRSWGHDPVYEESVPDEGDSVEQRISELAREHDIVVTTGGTSVGAKDYVIDALSSHGSVEFHRVRIRPGKPIAVARLPDHDALAVAIPGKPIGAYVSAVLVARVLFTGEETLPTLEREFTHDVGLGPEGFEYAIPVTLEGRTATPLGHVDSPLAVYEDTFDPSVLSSSTRAATADGFVLTTSDIAAGERVSVVQTSTLE